MNLRERVQESSYAPYLKCREFWVAVTVAFAGRSLVAALFPVLAVFCVVGRGMTWTEAGFVSGCFTLAVAAIAPRRGRWIDRSGVRKSLMPLLLGQVILWPPLVMVPKIWMYPIAAVLGMVNTPIINITRQLMMRVNPDDKDTLLTIDANLTEAAYIVGPAAGLGVTGLVNAYLGMMGVAALLLLLSVLFAIWDVPLVPRQVSTAKHPHESQVGLWSAPFMWWLAAMALTTFALVGMDLTIVGSLLSHARKDLLTFGTSAFAAGALIGGLVFGGLKKRPGLSVCVAAMVVACIVLAYASQFPLLVLPAAFIAGVPTTPVLGTLTANLIKAVPHDRVGEATGWQSSANTVGGAAASPLVGAVLDWKGAIWAGCVVSGVIGGLLAVSIAAIRATSRSTSALVAATGQSDQRADDDDDRAAPIAT